MAQNIPIENQKQIKDVRIIMQIWSFFSLFFLLTIIDSFPKYLLQTTITKQISRKSGLN